MIVETRRKRTSGFTLLELLVALVVLSLTVVALSQGVHTGLRIWDSQGREASRTAQLDSTARILRTLLSDIPASPVNALNPGSPVVAISFTGRARYLAFVGNLATGLGSDRLADITVSSPGDRVLLTWTPHRHELEDNRAELTETELLAGIAHLEFAYWGQATPDAVPGWLEVWDGPAIPLLIRVRLTFPAGDPRRWPALIVAPRL